MMNAAHSRDTTRDLASSRRARNVTAVLGPTNTGKTHLAIERMLAHKSGMIGLPLRLLAREVYDRVVGKVGPDAVALITGEEKIKPDQPRFWVCTVEAMPRDIVVDFVAVDEVQLAADPERGHVFTDRLFHARGTEETLLLGAGTMRETIRELLPGANFVSRPRLSKLTYAGQKKLSRLPRRSAIVAFSAQDVYEIAELVRRQRGGAAVVLGALSPRTRNAQVALYQSGDVDFLVATDAVGMGLNLNVEHVAFAGTRKFDGRQHRELTAGELGQIAGRAGRHVNDGTFGVTADVEPLATDVIDRLEKHEFEPIKVVQWRNGDLDFTSLDNLRDSLRVVPEQQRFTRARSADDVLALESAGNDPTIVERAKGGEAVSLLWEVCQVPDYRKVSPAAHADIICQIYKFVTGPERKIPEEWFAEQVSQASSTEGDIDTLANRIAHIRTWTFVSHRPQWLTHPEHWQERTREVEDALSDALHEQLTQRFIDKRTSTLMRRLRDEEELNAEIGEDGSVHVEKHFVGKLTGFRFIPESSSDNLNARAARNASAQVLGKELAMRARRVASAKNDALKLDRHGARVLWRGEEIARLEATDEPLKPSIVVLCDEHLAQADKEKVQARLAEWLNELIEERLKPLLELSRAEDVIGLARGIAFRLREAFGILKRETIAREIKELDQEARGQLRKYGVRFGAFNIFIPLLLKPAASELLIALWSLKNAERFRANGGSMPEIPRAGLTSVPANPQTPEDFYRVAGYHLCGPRAVRVDMLERLSDMIRPLTSFRLDESKPDSPPKGASGDGGFTVIPEMMSILGCSSGELSDVLKSLGFRMERRLKPKAPEVAATPAEGATDAASANVEPEPGPVALTSEADGMPARDQTVTGEAGSADALATIAEADGAADQRAVTVPADVEVPASSEAAMAAPAGETAESTSVDEPAPDVAVQADATKSAESEYIEVWRPRRYRDEQSQSRRQWHSKHPDPGTAGGTSEHARHGHGRRRDKEHHGHRGEHNRPNAGASSPPAPSDASSSAAAGPAAPASSGSQEQRPRHKEQRKGAPHKGGDRRPGGGREERRQGGYDPTSPFAALSELKQKLEEQRRNQSS
jgi:ATP-dependent RNA helicase SUPV3L1/SUV3